MKEEDKKLLFDEIYEDVGPIYYRLFKKIMYKNIYKILIHNWKINIIVITTYLNFCYILKNMIKLDKLSSNT